MGLTSLYVAVSIAIVGFLTVLAVFDYFLFNFKTEVSKAFLLLQLGSLSIGAVISIALGVLHRIWSLLKPDVKAYLADQLDFFAVGVFVGIVIIGVIASIWSVIRSVIKGIWELIKRPEPTKEPIVHPVPIAALAMIIGIMSCNKFLRLSFSELEFVHACITDWDLAGCIVIIF